MCLVRKIAARTLGLETLTYAHSFFILPDEYVNSVIALCVEKRGEEKSITEVDSTRSMMQYILPLNEILIDFFDKLKNKSSGYASFDYEDYGYAVSDLTKVRIVSRFILFTNVSFWSRYVNDVLNPFV